MSAFHSALPARVSSILVDSEPQTWQPNHTLTVVAGCADPVYTATADVYLSPSCRLLADGPGPGDRIYDGGGHRLVLPKGVDAEERLPTILIGAGKTLQLRNVTILHASSLAACLHLGPGKPGSTVLGLDPVHITHLFQRCCPKVSRWFIVPGA